MFLRGYFKKRRFFVSIVHFINRSYGEVLKTFLGVFCNFIKIHTIRTSIKQGHGRAATI